MNPAACWRDFREENNPLSREMTHALCPGGSAVESTLFPVPGCAGVRVQSGW